MASLDVQAVNRFTAPLVGICRHGALERYNRYWNADEDRIMRALEVEVGPRVAKALEDGENTLGWGYAYLRRICIVHNGREAAKGHVKPPEPVLGQLALVLS